MTICFKEVNFENEDRQMKTIYKEEVEEVEGNDEKGNIEEGNSVEGNVEECDTRKEDNDEKWGSKKGRRAEEGKDDVKVEGFKI